MKRNPYEISFSVEGFLENRYRVTLKSSTGHTIVVDEPPEFDGEGTGPNPIELFLASIAACIAITLKLHARRRRIRIDRIKVKAEGSFDLRGVLRIRGIEPGLERIKVNLHVIGSDSEAIKELVELTKRTFIVGSSVIRGTPIDIEYEITVQED